MYRHMCISYLTVDYITQYYKKTLEIDNEMKLDLLMTHLFCRFHIFIIFDVTYWIFLVLARLPAASLLFHTPMCKVHVTHERENFLAKFPIPIMSRDSLGNLLIEIYPLQQMYMAECVSVLKNWSNQNKKLFFIMAITGWN